MCDLINIVNPERLRGLMQHVATVVAGTDVVSIKPTKKPDSEGPPRGTVAAKAPKAPPPRGGVPQNNGTQESTGPPKGTQRAIPALRRDATQKMNESDRVASLAVLKGIPHGTKIDFNLSDSFSDEIRSLRFHLRDPHR